MIKLQAGRELDILVAEKVMGWERLDMANGATRLVPPNHIAEPAEAVPHYSTTQSDALKVANRMSELGGVVSYKFHELYDGFDMKKIEPGQRIEMVRIDPFEICMAALEAVDGQNV